MIDLVDVAIELYGGDLALSGGTFDLPINLFNNPSLMKFLLCVKRKCWEISPHITTTVSYLPLGSTLKEQHISDMGHVFFYTMIEEDDWKMLYIGL